MRRVTMLGLCLVATFAGGGLAAAAASAEGMHYVECARVKHSGAFATSSCTTKSETHTGPYELRFVTMAHRHPFTATATNVWLDSSIATVKCKAATIKGYVNWDGGWDPVVFRSWGCRMGKLLCTSAGQAEKGVVVGNEIAARLGALAGEGTENPIAGLGFVGVGSTAAPTAEFTCGTVEVRVHGALFGVVTGNFNTLSKVSTLSFQQSGGIEEYRRFESGLELGGPQRMEVKTSASGEFEPSGGAVAGYAATFTVRSSPLEIKEA